MNRIRQELAAGEVVTLFNPDSATVARPWLNDAGLITRRFPEARSHRPAMIKWHLA